MRKTFADIKAQGKIDSESKRLFIAGREIGFVYYRSGYQAEQYMDEQGNWDE